MNSTSTSLAIVANRVLPSLSGAQLTYNAEKNILLTMGYTSQAGNTYYRAIRLSPRLAVFYNIGEGYKYTFLNGITLFAFDGRKPRIIGQRTWGGYNWVVFSEDFARRQSILMVRDFLQGQMRMLNAPCQEQQLMEMSRQLIAETEQKRLM
ncbi:MAG: hypothetical protein MSS52_01655 [Prevotella sp.]|jgi:hypothetical protein|nr:hypothetical protein [Prevotella sp.]MDY3787502.1 hypothetical protein [Prevotella sp.]